MRVQVRACWTLGSILGLAEDAIPPPGSGPAAAAAAAAGPAWLATWMEAS